MFRPRILISIMDREPLPGWAFEKLRTCDVDIVPPNAAPNRKDLLTRLPGKHGLLLTGFSPINRINQEVLSAAGKPGLKVVSTMSVGYDHIDASLLHRSGVRIGYTPDVLNSDVADIAVCLTIAVLRNFKSNSRMVENDTWKDEYGQFFGNLGSRLRGKVLGIIGMGRIGQAVASRLAGFEVASPILYTSRSGPKDNEPAVLKLAAKHVEFEDLLSESDIVIITCSLTDETRGLFDKKAFTRMKSSSILVNVARGGIVNQDDLIEAVKSGEIAGAGLDVMSPEPLSPHHPLANLPNVLLLPHIGSATTETRSDMLRLAIDNLLAGVLDQPMPSELLL